MKCDLFAVAYLLVILAVGHRQCQLSIHI